MPPAIIEIQDSLRSATRSPTWGDVKRRGISMLPGIWEHSKLAISWNLQNVLITACTKDFWGAIITVSRSVSTVMNGASDQAFEYDGYG